MFMQSMNIDNKFFLLETVFSLIIASLSPVGENFATKHYVNVSVLIKFSQKTSLFT